jgi:F420-dependent oxidoreductase-like protein
VRIGLTGGGATVEKVVRQAKQAEAEGFTSLWYASLVTGDPLVAMALAGRETSRIELGTAVLQTYPCHPLLQANRVASVVDAMGRGGFTLGIGPSHEPLIRGVFGLSYDHPGRSTEEYLRIVTGLLRGEDVEFDGEDWTAHTGGRAVKPAHPVPVLVSALGPRLLRVAGEVADGTVLWMAPARAIESHVVPKVQRAAAAAGRPAPRIVAGLPVAVHDDEAEARAAAVAYSTAYAGMANYQRILEIGNASTPADAAIVGDEASVRAQLQSLLDAGATDIWAATFPVGDNREDRAASIQRTTDLLKGLVPESVPEPESESNERGVNMGSSRRVGADTSKTRDVLLDSVLRLMLDEGYAGVTYRAVAAKAGVTAGLVQYYFRTLDDLFVAAIRRGSEQNLERLTEALRKQPDQPLRVLWDYSRDESTAALTTEFLALGNHRESIRSEIAEVTEQVRRVQLDALAEASRASGQSPLGGGDLSPAALLFLTTGIPKLLRLEQGVGVSTTHAEVVEAFERYLDTVEPS